MRFSIQIHRPFFEFLIILKGTVLVCIFVTIQSGSLTLCIRIKYLTMNSLMEVYSVETVFVLMANRECSKSTVQCLTLVL